MFQDQGSRIPGSVVAAGGVLWLVKLIVIVGTGGRVVDSGAAAVFYVLGLLALVVGAALLGYWLTQRQRLLVRIVASAVAVVGFVIAYLILDTGARFLVGARGPEYVPDEAGIFLTAVVALGVGAWLLVREAGRAGAGVSRQS
jgi:hypothetical protein